MTMETAEALADCRFCSLVSQANGEDPIGTASPTDHWLIVEIPQPWSRQIFMENPRFQPVFAEIRQLLRRGIKLKPLAIAPDRDYSQPGYTRILYYHRPAKYITVYEKREYSVPDEQVTLLATAILQQIANPSNDESGSLSRFESYRQTSDRIRELLVCTHGNVDAACARFGFPIYEKLRHDYAARSAETLRVWRCSHFGGHQYAPTLIDLPEGRYWGHLEPDVLDVLVHRSGSPGDLRRFYRGWAGLSKFEQIAEREIWMREGWDWLTYPKRGQIVRLGEGKLKSMLRKVLQPVPANALQLWLSRSQQAAHWATVRLDFISPEQGGSYYEADVEISGQIMTAIRSSQSMELVPINQYRVNGLRKG